MSTSRDRSAAADPESTESVEPDEGFVARWSRRKHLSRAGPEVASEPSIPSGPVMPPGHEVATESAATEPTAPAELTDADMPPIEVLDEHSDYSGFFSPEVSEQLRGRALRKLFLSAKFNVVDGLDDYDEDFRNFELLGDIITSDMRHHIERKAEQAKQQLADRGSDAPADEASADSSAGSDTVPEAQPARESADENDDVDHDDSA